jgi:hypothetical protein
MNRTLLACLRASTAVILLQGSAAFGAERTTEQAIDHINSCLRHSSILRIDEDGLVRMRTPARELRFNIKDAAFNLNDGNGDHRVRVACLEPMVSGDPDFPRDEPRRESFVCRSRREAREAIEALRQVRQTYVAKDSKHRHLDRALASPDPDIPFTRVSEALDRLNDLLQVSVAIGIDPSGILSIDGADTLFTVDLARADFMVNDADGDPRVRVYGDWCLEARHGSGRTVKVARESFTAGSLRSARKAVFLLYCLKASVTGQNLSRIPTLRNVTGASTRSYTTLSQAIDALNDRLTVSVVLGVDAKGVATINAPEAVYRMDLNTCEFRPEGGREERRGFFSWVTRDPAVLIRSTHGLDRESDGVHARTVDEERFHTPSRADAEEAAKALAFIRGALKGRG